MVSISNVKEDENPIGFRRYCQLSREERMLIMLFPDAESEDDLEEELERDFFND